MQVCIGKMVKANAASLQVRACTCYKDNGEVCALGDGAAQLCHQDIKCAGIIWAVLFGVADDACKTLAPPNEPPVCEQRFSYNRRVTDQMTHELSKGYVTRSRIRLCRTCLLALSVCFLFKMSLTRFTSPHKPAGGCVSRALILLQTSCILHLS